MVKDLRWVGIPAVYDEKPAIFPSGFPMTDCSLYYGWYAGGMSRARWLTRDFDFKPGAIAVHIHSYSASSLRHADAGWVAPLLVKGAAASLGNVYEPYLQMTAHLDIFNDRLLHGFTFAESAYMATRALSWMSVVVGDPLYRPFGAWSDLSARSTTTHSRGPWEMAHAFAAKNAGMEPVGYFKLARQAASRADNAPMLEDLGLAERESGDYDGAISCLRQARTIYKGRGDLLRVALEQSEILLRAAKKMKLSRSCAACSILHPTARPRALCRKWWMKSFPRHRLLRRSRSRRLRQFVRRNKTTRCRRWRCEMRSQRLGVGTCARGVAVCEITISLHRRKQDSALMAENNGAGIEPNGRAKGIGLRIMHYRERVVQGAYTVELHGQRRACYILPRIRVRANGSVIDAR